MQTIDISSRNDVIDVRDITERVEALEDDRDAELIDEDEVSELQTLTELLEELKGNGGDHVWRGD